MCPNHRLVPFVFLHVHSSVCAQSKHHLPERFGACKLFFPFLAISFDQFVIVDVAAGKGVLPEVGQILAVGCQRGRLLGGIIVVFLVAVVSPPSSSSLFTAVSPSDMDVIVSANDMYLIPDRTTVVAASIANSVIFI